MDYFPLFMDVRGRPCLVVGGGEVAARKIALLLRAGARVRVVAPQLTEAVRPLASDPAFTYLGRGYESADLDGVALAVAATDDPNVNAAVSVDARARQLPVNVVDAPALCTFMVPALVERASVLVAIGTGGNAPVLARLLRGRIEAALPVRYGSLVELCAKLRGQVRSALPDLQRRRRFWEHVLEGSAAELVFRGELAAAEASMLSTLAQHAGSVVAAADSGEAYLIGVGPNDPELVSFRALRLLQRAELVLFDGAVAQAIVELSRRDAHQVRIDGLLADAQAYALPRMAAAVGAGQRVCVLAVGDAFRESAGRVFEQRARGAGVSCQVVPGIT